MAVKPTPTQNRELGPRISGSNPGNILSRLFWTTLHDLGVSPERFSRYCERYALKHKGPRSRLEVLSGIKDALYSTSMTIKTFVRGVDFLSVPRWRLILELEHRNGQITQHSVRINQEDFLEEGEDPTEEEGA